MPEINLIDQILYQPNDPYNYQKDNAPLIAIYDILNLINYQVDIDAQEIRVAKGTAGSIGLRLNQSLDDNGFLKTTAVNNSLHNIGYHIDGSYNGVDYVRMTQDERDKLDLMADGSTALKIRIEDGISDSYITFENETITLESSDEISIKLTTPNILSFCLNFDTNSLHLHYYDISPVRVGSNYQNWKTTTTNQEFIPKTLRLVINGIRIPRSLSISQGDETNKTIGVYIPQFDGPENSWEFTTFTEQPSLGRFTLNREIDSNDIIKIDFDVKV